MNLADGDVYNVVNGEIKNQDITATFKENAIPSTEDWIFPVDEYDYLAMNYLLVGADKETVNVEFKVKDETNGKEKTRTVGSVPVQRNYRTNIYGNILTSDVDVNVEIKPGFSDDDKYGVEDDKV